jgi:hypothetical protein
LSEVAVATTGDFMETAVAGVCIPHAESRKERRRMKEEVCFIITLADKFSG